MATKTYIFIAFLFLNLIFVPRAFASSANHLVISEIQTSGGVGHTDDDFVEIYNPTNQNINLDGYRLVKRTASGTSDSSIKVFSSSDIIPAFGFYLWANSDFSSITTAADATSSSYIANDNGVAIRYGSLDTGIIVDSVGWGTASNAFVENLPATNPGVGGSIERKPGELDPEKGNGEDSDNNSSDFLLRDAPDPQNSSSPIEIPEGMSLPENQPPVADCGGDRTVVVGTQVGFDGALSSDSDGSITTYAWNFGDGSSSNENSPSHTYDQAQIYGVELTVADDDGDSNMDTCQISVIDAPVYSESIFLNEIFPYPNSTYDWDGDGIADSNDEWIELVNIGDEEVDLGDWILDDIEDGGSSPYIIPVGTLISPDGYLVFYKEETGLTLNNTGDTVILKNPDGMVIDQYSYSSPESEKSLGREIEGSDDWEDGYDPSPGESNSPPSNQYPIANAGSSITNAKTGEAVNFNGSSSYDNDGQIVSYLWSFGNGATSSGATTSYAYSVPGTYQVSLTVTDDDGATSTANINVSVVQSSPSNTIYQNELSELIKITEIMPNPEGDDGEKEYIKIENFDVKNVNLRGWSLDDEDGGSKPFAIDYDLVLKPKTPITFYSLDTKISLNNSGDQTRLFDPNKKQISFVEYKESAKEGIAYYLENGAWKWREVTSSTAENTESKKEEEQKESSNTDKKDTTNPKTTVKKETQDPSVKVGEGDLSENIKPNIQVLANSVEAKNSLENGGGNIIFSLGEKTNTKPSEGNPVSRDSSENNIDSAGSGSGKEPSESPRAAIPVMALSLLAISRFFFRPEDIKSLLTKLSQGTTEELERIERLFK